MKGWITGWWWTVLAAVASAWLMAGCASLPTRVRPAVAFQPADGPVIARVAEPVAVEAPHSAPEGVAAPLTNAPPEPKGRILVSGDRVRITLRHQAVEGPFEQVIDDEGKINLPLIGPVEVGGMLVSDAQKLVEKLYVDGQYYKQITAMIVPPESEYTIYGEVIRPGAFPLNRGLTLLTAIARSGRFTEFADPSKTQVRRGSETIKANVPRIQKGLDPDPDIFPGDVIYVPPTWY